MALLPLLLPSWEALLPLFLLPGLCKHCGRVPPVGGGAQALQEEQGGVMLHSGIQGCRLARAQRRRIPLCPCHRLMRLLRRLCRHRRLCQLAPPQQVAQVELPGPASSSKAAAAGWQRHNDGMESESLQLT